MCAISPTDSQRSRDVNSHVDVVSSTHVKNIIEQGSAGVSLAYAAVCADEKPADYIRRRGLGVSRYRWSNVKCLPGDGPESLSKVPTWIHGFRYDYVRIGWKRKDHSKECHSCKCREE